MNGDPKNPRVPTILSIYTSQILSASATHMEAQAMFALLAERSAYSVAPTYRWAPMNRISIKRCLTE
jgi:hypothetical protein